MSWEWEKPLFSQLKLLACCHRGEKGRNVPYRPPEAPSDPSDSSNVISMEIKEALEKNSPWHIKKSENWLQQKARISNSRNNFVSYKWQFGYYQSQSRVMYNMCTEFFSQIRDIKYTLGKANKYIFMQATWKKSAIGKNLCYSWRMLMS